MARCIAGEAVIAGGCLLRIAAARFPARRVRAQATSSAGSHLAVTVLSQVARPREGTAGSAALGASRCARRHERRGDAQRTAAGDGSMAYEARKSAPCNRPISARRKTRLKRSWQAAETCSSRVELTFSTVTPSAARIVALRLAPWT